MQMQVNSLTKSFCVIQWKMGFSPGDWTNRFPGALIQRAYIIPFNMYLLYIDSIELNWHEQASKSISKSRSTFTMWCVMVMVDLIFHPGEDCEIKPATKILADEFAEETAALYEDDCIPMTVYRGALRASGFGSPKARLSRAFIIESQLTSPYIISILGGESSQIGVPKIDGRQIMIVTLGHFFLPGVKTQEEQSVF